MSKPRCRHCNNEQRSSPKEQQTRRRWTRATPEQLGDCGSRLPSTVAAKKRTSGLKGHRRGHQSKWLSTACTELHRKRCCKSS